MLFDVIKCYWITLFFIKSDHLYWNKMHLSCFNKKVCEKYKFNSLSYKTFMIKVWCIWNQTKWEWAKLNQIVVFIRDFRYESKAIEEDPKDRITNSAFDGKHQQKLYFIYLFMQFIVWLKY